MIRQKYMLLNLMMIRIQGSHETEAGAVADIIENLMKPQKWQSVYGV